MLPLPDDETDDGASESGAGGTGGDGGAGAEACAAMTADEEKAIQEAVRSAKELKDGSTYLLFVRKGTISREVLDRIGSKEFRFIIVQVMGHPADCAQLYKLEAVKPQRPERPL